MTEEKEMSNHEYMMEALCRNAENFKTQLIQLKQQIANNNIALKDISSLLVNTSVEIAELERKGVKRPDPEKVKEANDKAAQQRAGGAKNS